MNQTIKKFIIGPLIYPFHKENYKSFIISGVFLSLFVLLYFQIEFLNYPFLPRFFARNDFFIMVIFSFLLYYIEIGYITMVFENSINGKDNLPSWKNAKKLVICILKGFGYSTIYTTIVWYIIISMYLISRGSLPFQQHININIITALIVVPLWAILYNSFLISASWELLTVPISCPDFWNMMLLNSNYMYISLLISLYVVPLLILKLHNRKISLKYLPKFLFSREYLLIATFSGICFVLIFKCIVWGGIEKVFIIFYLLIVIARMFGVYFREINNIRVK